MTTLTPCEVKTHFDCNGEGTKCDCCGESPSVCVCGDEGPESTSPCEDCDGTGRLCIEHDSPCGQTGRDAKCDVALKETT